MTLRGLTADHEPEWRGSAAEAQRCNDPEWILSGPAETGKTFAGLWRLDSMLRDHPGAQCTLIRKVLADVHGSCLQTYMNILGLRRFHKVKVRRFGGARPDWFDYDNGSRLWIAGMDRPGRALSSERDGVYVNQAEELSLDAWETLTTRTTGRAGHVPFPMLFGDCNPGAHNHWIRRRDRLRLLPSFHTDNPRLYRRDGTLTNEGVRSMANLEALTGLRRDRYLLGLWKSAEGVVYEFDPDLHVLPAGFMVPPGWLRFRSIDFGYTNPFVCQWWAVDPDGRMVLYREIYMSQRIVADHAKQIVRLSAGEKVEATVADHDLEDRETLHRAGVYTIPALKDITTGIQAVQDRLAKQGDGRPRLYVVDRCRVEVDSEMLARGLPTSTEEEFPTYVWPKGADGKPLKEEPVGVNDHGMDATRYAVMWADRRERAGEAHARSGLPARRTADRPTFRAGIDGRGRPTFRPR